MQKIVIDSSVIVKWLNQNNEALLEQADKIIQHALENNVLLFAPELAKYEIGNTLLIRKKISTDEARKTFNNFFILPIQFVGLSETGSYQTYKIAQDLHITYYDACFIALAQQENATLVTDNIKHQGKSSKIKIIALKDY